MSALGSPNTCSSIVPSLLTHLHTRTNAHNFDCYISKVVFFFSRCSLVFVKFKFHISPMKSFEMIVANS